MIERIKLPPRTPGVYLFYKGAAPIYIGKAANLKKRLASYFRKNASEKVRRLREEATKLEWIETNSEIEALIKEAELIKRHLPKFNVLMRDDKSYFYVALTRDAFARVAVVHKTKFEKGIYRDAIGPFTSGSALHTTLKLLRRIFPYCTCRELHKRPCLNAQIGRCLGYCCLKLKNQESGIKNQGEYRDNIKRIIAVLGGKRTRLLSKLKHEIRAASKAQEYERAASLRDQIEGIENIFQHKSLLEVGLHTVRSPTSNRAVWRSSEPIIRQLLGVRKKIKRVEGYDISNISGTAATGSMVVFINGKPAKSEYRKFRIKTVPQAHDVAMHQEVIRRRLAYPEWGMPDVIVLDGGLSQLHAVQAVLRQFRSPTSEISEVGLRNIRNDVLLTALAKRQEELYIEGREKPVRLDSLPRDAMHFFQHVRDESHRFAKKYHHKLREIHYRDQSPKPKN